MSELYRVSPEEAALWARDRFLKSVWTRGLVSSDYFPRFPKRVGTPVHHVSLISRTPMSLAERLLAPIHASLPSIPDLSRAQDERQLLLLPPEDRHLTWDWLLPGNDAHHDADIIGQAAAALPGEFLEAMGGLPAIDARFNGFTFIGAKQISATIVNWFEIYEQMAFLRELVPSLRSEYKLDESPLHAWGPPVQVTIAGTRGGIPTSLFDQLVRPLLPSIDGAPAKHRFSEHWRIRGADLVVHGHNIPNHPSLFGATEWLGYVGFGTQLKLVQEGSSDRLPDLLDTITAVPRELQSTQPWTSAYLANEWRTIDAKVGSHEFDGFSPVGRTIRAKAKIIGIRDPLSSPITKNATDAVDKIDAVMQQLQYRGAAFLTDDNRADAVAKLLDTTREQLRSTPHFLAEIGATVLGVELLTGSLSSEIIVPRVERELANQLSNTARLAGVDQPASGIFLAL